MPAAESKSNPPLNKGQLVSYHKERMEVDDSVDLFELRENTGEGIMLPYKKKFWKRGHRFTERRSLRKLLKATILGTGLFLLGFYFGAFWGLFMPIVGAYICYRVALLNYAEARLAGIIGAIIGIGMILYSLL